MDTRKAAVVGASRTIGDEGRPREGRKPIAAKREDLGVDVERVCLIVQDEVAGVAGVETELGVEGERRGHGG